MPEALVAASLGWLVAAAFVAGIVYGFAGFGAALVFMPVAVIFVAPEVAVASFAVAAVASLVTLVPRAWGVADRRAAMTMLAGACLTAPAGLWVLRSVPTERLQWTICATVALTLAALMSGWRHETPPTRWTRLGIGGATGFVGGATGLMGPIMVLFQLAGRDTVARGRANALIFLTLASLALVPLLALQGALSTASVLLGLVLLVPYGVGSQVGQALFRPERERLYRWVAYAVIAAAVLAGLPIWT